jgi:hypothetical protein
VSPIRRFVLVATVATGGLFWASLPLHSPYRRCYPLVGLLAAVVSAAVSQGPRIADYLLGRVVLAGCVSLGTLSFVAIGWSNITGTAGVHHGAALAVIALVWLTSVGIIGKLLIARCRAWTIYFGFVLGAESLALTADHRDGLGAAIIGLALAGLVPALVAAITGALQRRFGASDRPDLPDARVVE